MNQRAAASDTGRESFRPFVLRVLIAIGIYALALLAWRIRDAFLLAFASILVAVLLSACAGPIRKWTGLSRIWALAAAGGAILLALALLGWLIGAQVRSQVAELAGNLPGAIENVEQRFGISIPMGNLFNEPEPESRAPPDAAQEAARVASKGDQPSGFSAFDDLLYQLTSWGRTIVAIVAGLILVIIGGFFFATNPGIYRQGLVKLVPKSQHARAEETLTDCGRALHLWLMAELIAMAIVGVLAGLGTWAIGLEAPLALGLFAGLTEFVPIVGPIVGAVPALLLAITHGTGTLLWTLALFLAIQQLESNVITPLIQKRMVEVPPALFLFAVLAFGLLFGLLGILIAAPLTVVAYVAVKKLYVRDTLGEPTEIPGER